MSPSFQALALSSPPKRRMAETTTNTESASPPKRQRILAPIAEENEENEENEEIATPTPTPASTPKNHTFSDLSLQRASRYGTEDETMDKTSRRDHATSTSEIPECLMLSTPSESLVEKSVEERLAELLPALQSPDRGVERLERRGEWEGVEMSRLMPRVVAREQSLLGPGRNWKDAWFYNLFCEFKIFAQIVGMGRVGEEDMEGLEEGEIRENVMTGEGDGDMERNRRIGGVVAVDDRDKVLGDERRSIQGA